MSGRDFCLSFACVGMSKNGGRGCGGRGCKDTHGVCPYLPAPAMRGWAAASCGLFELLHVQPIRNITVHQHCFITVNIQSPSTTT